MISQNGYNFNFKSPRSNPNQLAHKCQLETYYEMEISTSKKIISSPQPMDSANCSRSIVLDYLPPLWWAVKVAATGLVFACSWIIGREGKDCSFELRHCTPWIYICGYPVVANETIAILIVDNATEQQKTEGNLRAVRAELKTNKNCIVMLTTKG